jgi:predicted PurR-regulated permease PerM
MKYVEHPFSWAALFRIITVGFVVYFVWKSITIIVAILIAVMLATALNPIVKLLNKRLPKIVSTLIVILLLFVPFLFIGATILPNFIKELPDLVRTVDTLVNKSPLLPDVVKKTDFTQYAQSGASYVLRSTSFITQAVTGVFTVLVLTFYFIFDANRLITLFLALFPKPKRKKIAKLLSDLALINGRYIRGNLLISIICGVFIFVGLTILHIPYAAPLAIFAALLDLLPLIGSTIAMIPPVIIGFSISPFVGIMVIVLYLLYQQVENNIIAPLVYRQTLDLSAALSFIAVIIGSSLFGIVGAFLALPVAASVPAVIKYFREDLYTNTKFKQERDIHLKQ